MQENKNFKCSAFKQTSAAVFTLINTMMGVALLTLPYTFARVGVIPAITIMIVETLFSVLGFYAITEVTHHMQQFTLQQILTQLFGRPFAIINDICIVSEYIGFLIAYISVFADYINVFIKQVTGGYDFKVVYLKLICAPILMLLTSLSNLSIISQLSLIALLFIIVAVVATIYLYAKTRANNIVEVMLQDQSILFIEIPPPRSLMWPIYKHKGKALAEVILRTPMFMPLFAIQMSIPVLYNDIKGTPQQKKQIINNANYFATGISFVLYLLNAICCYFLFGRYTLTNELLTFPSTNILMTAVRFLYAIVVLLSFVAIVYPIRWIAMDWVRVKKGSYKGNIAFHCTGLVLIVVTVILSIFVPDIVDILNFASSFFGLVIYWILPTLIIYKIKSVRNLSVVKEIVNPIVQEEVKKESFFSIYKRLSQHYDKVAPGQIHEQHIVSREELVQDFVKSQIKTRSKSVYKVEQEIEPRKRTQSVALSTPAHANEMLEQLGGIAFSEIFDIKKEQKADIESLEDKSNCSNQIDYKDDPVIAIEECNEEKQKEMGKANHFKVKEKLAPTIICYVFVALFTIYNLMSFALIFVKLD